VADAQLEIIFAGGVGDGGVANVVRGGSMRMQRAPASSWSCRVPSDELTEDVVDAYYNLLQSGDPKISNRLLPVLGN
jgi:hypothetical protein